MPLTHTKDKLQRLSKDERLGQNRDSEYLGAEDVDPGIEPIMTIDGLYNGLVTLQRGKENKDVLSFAERSVNGIKNVRPLIVNATNRKTLKKLFGDVRSETLEGKQIQLYIDHKVRNPEDGSLTDGIRIRPFAPKSATIKCEDCGNIVTPAYGMQPDALVKYTAKKYGKAVCAECATRIAQGTDVKENVEEDTNENNAD